MSAATSEYPEFPAEESRAGASSLRRLRAAATVLGFSQDTTTRLFDSLTSTWLDSYNLHGGNDQSDISDDGSPIELSIALGKRKELRLLVEAQSADASMSGLFEAGEGLNQHLAQQFDVRLSTFSKFKELFRPTEKESGRFAMWHAGVARLNGELAFKVYVNPNIHGTERGLELLFQALERLELPHAIEFLRELQRARTMPLECLYFSVDLDALQGSRVKFYIPHRNATLASLDQELSPTTCGIRWDARQVLRTLVGKGPFQERPILSCFSFSQERTTLQHTLHVPVRCYHPNDEEVMRRLEDLASAEVSSLAREAVEATAECSLKASRGHVSYVSVKRDQSDVTITLYLSTHDILHPSGRWLRAQPLGE